MINNFIEITKLILVSGWLIFFTIIDLQIGSIPNKWMKWFLIMSFGFILLNLQDDAGTTIISFVIVFLITEIVYHFKGIGGADIKVLWILSLLYPFPINGYPFFALLVFGVAGIAIGLNGMITAMHRDQTISDIKNYKVPFMPFLLGGYLIMCILLFQF